MKTKRLILTSNLCPGDILTLTAAVESLHATYPREYKTAVRTTAMAIWDHNPHVVKIADQFGETISCHYPSVNTSSQLPYPFLEGFTKHLGEVIGRPLRLTTNRPHLYLSEQEKGWMSQVAERTGGKPIKYWLVNAGSKNDYPAKQWPVEYYQAVVEATRDRIQWVQIGSLEHNHPALAGVIDLRGATDHRQLIRLVYHAQGGVGPVTYLQHLCAAFEKPYVCLLGGRESATWVTYPRQYTLHTIGTLDCCRGGGCWKSRVVKLNDSDPKDNSLCDHPQIGFTKPVGKCMAMISPEEVVTILRRLT